MPIARCDPDNRTGDTGDRAAILPSPVIAKASCLVEREGDKKALVTACLSSLTLHSLLLTSMSQLQFCVLPAQNLEG